MDKLFALPFGADGFSGDSAFYLDRPGEALEVDAGAAFGQVLALWQQRSMDRAAEDDDELCDDQLVEVLEGEEAPVGFWLLTGQSLEVACVPYDDAGGNDGSTYQANRTAKRLCAKLAVKVLGDGSVLEEKGP